MSFRWQPGRLTAKTAQIQSESTLDQERGRPHTLSDEESVLFATSLVDVGCPQKDGGEGEAGAGVVDENWSSCGDAAGGTYEEDGASDGLR